MWLYYWLAAQGIDPLRDVRTITVPPPQMVASMRALGFAGAHRGAAARMADRIASVLARP